MHDCPFADKHTRSNIKTKKPAAIFDMIYGRTSQHIEQVPISIRRPSAQDQKNACGGGALINITTLYGRRIRLSKFVVVDLTIKLNTGGEGSDIERSHGVDRAPGSDGDFSNDVVQNDRQSAHVTKS